MTDALIVAVEFGETIRIERRSGNPMYTLTVHDNPAVPCVDWMDLLEEFERRFGEPKTWQWILMRDLGDYGIDDAA